MTLTAIPLLSYYCIKSPINQIQTINQARFQGLVSRDDVVERWIVLSLFLRHR